MGPNGSGKSNLGYALFDIVYTLTDKTTCFFQKDAQSFINGNGDSKFATFKYEFQHGGSVINYEYRKTLPNSLTYEKLTTDGKVILEFDHEKNCLLPISDLGMVNGEKLRLDGRDGSLSIVRFIANNTIQEENSPIVFLMDFVSRMLYFKSTQDGNMFIGLERAGDDVESYFVRNGLVEDFERFLREYAELEVKLGTTRAPGMPEAMVQKFKSKSILFSNVSSSGTKALELFYYWSKRFDKVSLLFIDEFDAYYHFELAEKIVRQLFKYSTTQVVLTSHNTSIVSNRVMRPDCYLQIMNGKISSFSESTERELREGHNLEKMLRNGEFNE
jgi:AAA15 family ATPase/GTPase